MSLAGSRLPKALRDGFRKIGECRLGLRLLVHVTDYGHAALDFLVADDDDEGRAGLVGPAELALETPAHEVPLDPDSASSHSSDDGIGQALRLFSQQGEVDEGHGGGSGSLAEGCEPFDTYGPAAPGHVRSSHGADEAVVASAGRDGVLGPQAVGDPLERRPRVVVEAADKAGRLDEADAEIGQAPLDGVEVAVAGRAEMLGKGRGLFGCLAAGRDLAIQDAERVRSDPPPAVFAEAAGAFLQEGAEGRDVVRPADGTADRVEEERPPRTSSASRRSVRREMTSTSTAGPEGPRTSTPIW